MFALRIPRKKMRFPNLLVLVLYFQMCRLVKPNQLNKTTDQAALLQLKAHITLDPLNFFAHNWSTFESPCNWVGVTCGARHRRVTDLNLPYVSFGGTIPPHLGNLSFLVSLNLSGNNFHGNLPKELWQLRRLKIIDLAYNSLSGSLPGGICKTNFPEIIWLDSNDISGQLPSSLGDCSKLRSLVLTDNKFTGRIPHSIGNLTQLQQLFLDGNSLEGTIPPSIFNISSLEQIVLSNNSLSGSLPSDLCHSLPSLDLLALYKNKLTGSLPKDIGNCTLLTALDLAKNHFTGEMPSEIGNLYNLIFLDISFSNLTGFIPSTIFNISSIEKIGLNQNQFTGRLPSTIGLYLPNLIELYLPENLLSGTIPGSICNASELVILELSRNSFSGPIPDTLGNCRQLQKLSLVENNLTTGSSTLGWSFLSSLTNCRDLRILGIGENPLKGVLPGSVANLSTSLEIFYAAASELNGGIPVEVGNLGNMIFFTLRQNNLTGSIPSTLGKLQKVQALELNNNKLKGPIPSVLCELQSLDTLLLQNNELQGGIPTCFGNLTSLRYLNLASNKFNSTIPSTIWTLRFILEMDLSFNSLSGSLPLDIGNLEVLIKINLTRNQLSGNIPSSIGKLKGLTSLFLVRNRFQGLIPQSFGGLISLETLDLSCNNLSGSIPKSLEALSHLNYFNVSFNRLEGEIPMRGPFVNFSAGSFISNQALCGAPRLNLPPCRISSKKKAKRTSNVKYILPAILSVIILVALLIFFIRYRKRDKSQPTEASLLDLATWRRISYYELRRLTDGFSESNLLGIGSFGSVYKGTLSDGMNVAVKVFNLQLDGALKSFNAECEVLSQIRHRNLVKIISSCSNTGFKAIILQYMSKGSLEKWLYSHNHFLDIPQTMDIMIDVASALEYLHHGYSIPVIHCDLKPNNVLLDDDMVAHVGDFGIAKLLDGDDSVRRHTMTLATIGYMAPEYGLEGMVSTSGDVYSFGILLMETFTRKKPTDEMFTGEMSLKHWVEESLPDALTDVADATLLSKMEDHFAAKKACISSIMALALRCAEEVPEQRMNMKDALVTLKKIKTKFLKDVAQA